MSRIRRPVEIVIVANGVATITVHPPLSPTLERIAKEMAAEIIADAPFWTEMLALAKSAATGSRS